MRMKKNIQIALVRMNGDRCVFKIIYQSHIGKYFGEERGYPTPDVPSNVFATREKIELRSSAGPAWSPSTSPYQRLYVRGNERIYDDSEVECSLFEYKRIIKALTEYNLFYGGGVPDINEIIPSELFEL
jgi:hypothetical protein